MAIVDIQDHPKLSNPQRKSQLLQTVLNELDNEVNLLGLVAQAAECLEASDKLTSALTTLHTRLDERVTRLFSLL